MAVIAIDWDATIVDERTNPLPGAIDAIKLLREKGHKVVINSCNDPKWIKKNLEEWGCPVDHIMGLGTGPTFKNKSKVLADLYVDDRGYHFPYKGNWDNEIQKILEDDRVKDKDNRKW